MFLVDTARGLGASLPGLFPDSSQRNAELLREAAVPAAPSWVDASADVAQGKGAMQAVERRVLLPFKRRSNGRHDLGVSYAGENHAASGGHGAIWI